ncbi:hypothetical protein B0H17DRAFT_1222859 [Mycena rosella]|uniref:Uncharacterized protein n=1 Tax=Mycena rosella TaxID=1033263 RepID=A0AAD7AWQ8_MYCRO|nr:hypothetical protein B0H17DRAFT_1222859 [Mycena rosella]
MNLSDLSACVRVPRVQLSTSESLQTREAPTSVLAERYVWNQWTLDGLARAVRGSWSRNDAAPRLAITYPPHPIPSNRLPMPHAGELRARYKLLPLVPEGAFSISARSIRLAVLCFETIVFRRRHGPRVGVSGLGASFEERSSRVPGPPPTNRADPHPPSERARPTKLPFLLFSFDSTPRPAAAPLTSSRRSESDSTRIYPAQVRAAPVRRARRGGIWDALMLRTPTPHTLDACGAPTGMRTVFRRLCPTRLPVLRAPLGCRYGYEYGASKGARAILRPHLSASAPCPAPEPCPPPPDRHAPHLPPRTTTQPPPPPPRRQFVF